MAAPGLEPVPLLCIIQYFCYLHKSCLTNYAIFCQKGSEDDEFGDQDDDEEEDEDEDDS